MVGTVSELQLAVVLQSWSAPPSSQDIIAEALSNKNSGRTKEIKQVIFLNIIFLLKNRCLVFVTREVRNNNFLDMIHPPAKKVTITPIVLWPQTKTPLSLINTTL